MTFRTLILFYAHRGGAKSRETAFGQISEQGVPLQVRFNHGTFDIYALAPNGQVDLRGTVIADAPAEEVVSWLEDGNWPLRSLQELGARISEVNGRYAFQEFRRSLPKAGPRALCVDCGKRAHRVYRGKALCDDCLCRRKGGP